MSRAHSAPADLKGGERAALLRALSRLNEAGLPGDRAVAAMGDLLGPRHAQRFRDMSMRVARGAALAEAGRQVGLLGARDYRLLRLAEGGGKLPLAAARLAAAHEHRARTLRQLRGRMLVPLLVLVLALFLLPLPALVGGRFEAPEYVMSAVGPLAVLLAAVYALAGVMRRAEAEGAAPGIGRLGRSMPLLGAALARDERIKLVEGLALLLDAGLAAEKALEAAIKALSSSAAEGAYGAALGRLEGKRLSDALSGAGVLDAEGFAIVSTSEEAGRIVDGLERVAVKLREDARHDLDLLSTWLPRSVYVLVALVVAGGIMG